MKRETPTFEEPKSQSQEAPEQIANTEEQEHPILNSKKDF